MANDAQGNLKYAKMWGELANVVNDLPVEERDVLRNVLAELLHDMKHTLGLITNANEILRRYTAQDPDSTRSVEMIQIIRTGALQMDGYLNSMVEDFANGIEGSGRM